MRSRALLCFLLALSLAGCASSASDTPKSGLTVPDPGIAAEKCARLEEFKNKYRDLFRLGDWKIQIACLEIPDHEAAWALSFVEVHSREIVIAVDPDTPDMELTVAHELLHGVLSEVRAAQSELLEEQVVRAIAEAVICRPKVGDL